MGTNPWYIGPPCLRASPPGPRIINIHPVPYMATSKGVPPTGLAMPPDTSDKGRSRTKAIYEEILNTVLKPLIDLEEGIFHKVGAVDFVRPVLPFNTWTLWQDVTLQMCPPSLEFPRSDVPTKIRFAGVVPALPMKKDLVFPSFWSDVTGGDKNIVVVTQGTVAQDHNHLIIPTLRALADRQDVLTVAILGSKGATLPEDFALPANARVIDYLPYDAILPRPSAFVLNAGYGGFIHGVINGVPMVLGGDLEDKPDVALRGEWSGVAVNLRTGQPTVEQLTEAMDKVLEDRKYKKRVVEIKENEQMRAMNTVEKAILNMAALG